MRVQFDVYETDSKRKAHIRLPSNLVARVTAVKFLPRNKQAAGHDAKLASIPEEQPLFKEVGLQGKTEARVIGSQCVFSSLKFTTTCFKENASSFHLLISVFESTAQAGSNNQTFDGTQASKDQSQEVGSGPLRILVSKISAPFLVTSRKPSEKCQEKALFRAFDVSRVDEVLLMRPQASSQEALPDKLRNQKKSEQAKIITPDLEGLLNYYSAPNIRNKLVHPVFLALRFYQCVSIHYDLRAFPNLSAKQVTTELQRRLDSIAHDGEIGEGYQSRATGAPSPSFICCLDLRQSLHATWSASKYTLSQEHQALLRSQVNKLFEKKIAPLSNKSLTFVCTSQDIPRHFTKLSDLAQVKKAAASFQLAQEGGLAEPIALGKRERPAFDAAREVAGQAEKRFKVEDPVATALSTQLAYQFATPYLLEKNLMRPVPRHLSTIQVASPQKRRTEVRLPQMQMLPQAPTFNSVPQNTIDNLVYDFQQFENIKKSLEHSSAQNRNSESIRLILQRLSTAFHQRMLPSAPAPPVTHHSQEQGRSSHSVFTKGYKPMVADSNASSLPGLMLASRQRTSVMTPGYSVVSAGANQSQPQAPTINNQVKRPSQHI